MDAARTKDVRLLLQVSTRSGAKVAGWSFFLPLMGIVWLAGLVVVVSGIVACFSVTMWKDAPLLALLLLLVAGFIFLVMYFTGGWAHDFFATYTVTQEGISKRSPFWRQSVTWQQIAQWNSSGLGQVWWLLNARCQRMMGIDWHLLSRNNEAAMKAIVLPFLIPQLQATLAAWTAQGRLCRSPFLWLLAAGLGAIGITGPALGLWFKGIKSTSDIVQFSLFVMIVLFAWREMLRIVTTRVKVQGDQLVVWQFLRRVDIDLRMATGLRRSIAKGLLAHFWTAWAGSGVVLATGTAEVFLPDGLEGFPMLMLYLSQRLPQPTAETARSVASGKMGVWIDPQTLMG